MMLRLTLTSMLVALGSGVALADADCPAAPKDKWLSEADMKKKVNIAWLINAFIDIYK